MRDDEIATLRRIIETLEKAEPETFYDELFEHESSGYKISSKDFDFISPLIACAGADITYRVGQVEINIHEGLLPLGYYSNEKYTYIHPSCDGKQGVYGLYQLIEILKWVSWSKGTKYAKFCSDGSNVVKDFVEEGTK